MSKIVVWFYCKDFELHEIRCDRNVLLKDFLKLAQDYLEEEENFYYAFLKGKKMYMKNHIEDYIDDLENSAIFLASDEDEYLPEKDIIINIDNFEIKNQINGLKYGENSYKAVEKKSNKPVFIISVNENIFNCAYSYMGGCIYRDIRMFVYTHSLNLPGIAEIIGFRYPLKSKDASEKSDFNGFLFITEFLPNRSVDKDIREYIASNGAKNKKMNPTIRSKIIFGVAAALKQLHKNKIVYFSLDLEKLYLDDNFEV